MPQARSQARPQARFLNRRAWGYQYCLCICSVCRTNHFPMVAKLFVQEKTRQRFSVVGLHTLRTLENMVASRNPPVWATRWGQVTAGSSGGPKAISSQTSMFDLLCFYHLPSREPFLVRYPITSTCAYQSVETLMISPDQIRLGVTTSDIWWTWTGGSNPWHRFNLFQSFG